MKKSDLFDQLIPYTERTIASPIDINETLSRGFNYDFLKEIQKSDAPNTVADKIEAVIFKNG